MLFELVWNHILCSAGIKNKKQWILTQKMLSSIAHPQVLLILKKLMKLQIFVPRLKVNPPNSLMLQKVHKTL